jgi:hypothetical protein
MRIISVAGIVLVGVLVCGSSCREEPTIDLHLILAKPAVHLFNPVPNADGQVIYFLEDSSYDSSSSNVFNAAGDIRGVSASSGVDWPVLAGRFRHLSLSPGGTQLAAAEWDTSDSAYLVIVADTLGNVLDSLVVRVGGYNEDLSDLHFSLVDDAVLYMVYHWADSGEVQSRVYRKGLSGDTATTVAAECFHMVQKFALLPGDSILVDTSAGGAEDLAVCPTDTRWVIFAEQAQNIFVPWNWRVTDRVTGKVSHLSSATLPEDMYYLNWPSWMPNGKDMLFGTGSSFGPEGMHKGPAQLWSLHNALDYRR